MRNTTNVTSYAGGFFFFLARSLGKVLLQM